MGFITAIPSLFGGAAASTGALGSLGTALSIGGTLVQTAGAISKSRQEAKLAAENIRAIERQKQDDTKRRLRSSLKERGAARAKFAASGIDLSSDSPLLVLDEIIKVGEEDINAISAGAESEKRQQMIKQKAAISSGRNALLGGAFNVGGTLLSSRIKKQTKKM